MSTGIRIDVTDAPVRSALARAAAALRDPAAMLDAIGKMLISRTQFRFRDQRGPNGQPWKPSLRARLEGGQTLVDGGDLRRSITRQVTGNTLLVGTNVKYAAIHQFGGVIRAKTPRGLVFRLGARGVRGAPTTGLFRRKQSVTMPARPFLGIDAGDRAEIQRIATDHLRRATQE